jgi:TetR/AcrR family transcriptional regulator
MPRYTEDKREAIKSDTRRNLIHAALEEFARYGYEQANVNRISEAAGYAKGTIYNYFPSKQALMLALIDEIGNAHVKWVAAGIHSETAPSQRLEAFFKAGFAFVEQQPSEAHFLLTTLYSAGEEFRQALGKVYQPLFKLVATEILVPGIEQGEFRSVDPYRTATLLMTLYLGTASQVDEANKTWLNADEVTVFAWQALKRGDLPQS